MSDLIELFTVLPYNPVEIEGLVYSGMGDSGIKIQCHSKAG